MRSPAAICLVLVAGSLVGWTSAFLPAYFLQGEAAFVQSLAAWGLCLVPGVLVLMWVSWQGLAPEMQLMAVLAGTGIRMAVALGGGFLLYQWFPETFPQSFWMWVGGSYLCHLALEVLLALRIQRQTPMTHHAATLAAGRFEEK